MGNSKDAKGQDWIDWYVRILWLLRLGIVIPIDWFFLLHKIEHIIFESGVRQNKNVDSFIQKSLKLSIQQQQSTKWSVGSFWVWGRCHCICHMPAKSALQCVDLK